MGLLFSYFYGRTDDADPVTGLTSRDIYLVQSSWQRVRKDPTRSGTLVLLKFLEDFPDYKSLFPFGDVPMAELTIVDHLNEPELLTAILTKTGKNHKKLNDVPSKSFWELSDIIINVFKTYANKATADAWVRTLDYSVKVIEKGY